VLAASTGNSVGTGAPSVRARGVSKAFGHVQALQDVALDAYPSEILAVVGDNGAGKSTLVKTLSGVLRPDTGSLEIDGQAVSFHSPLDAREQGVATVFQDLALVEVLDVATNMFLGRTPKRGPFVDRKRMLNEAADQLQALKIRLPSLRVPVGMLSGGQRQAVAVARAVMQGSGIVVMDEPTAALGVRETAQVIEIMRELRAQGRTVIVISHDFELVFDVADRVQVMRLGRRVGVRRTAETTRQDIVGLVTGSIAPDAAEES
jgi:ABC-type sugar transport system ATPase subunit